ncbi:unnamed protein product [Cyberlindnera jadinii]|uniref:Small ribosomal subunit protein uS10m n=1 Tax=Cyberlindnera jadinii (strain ATCC 18201 / CBS 1600 / BCRC 20928 / JCM 3617 / NBRC 0987 / NRRL Y-1542) TaxID=983966 RepID=A0A0H5C1V1_CYBJN|nr:ribosomal protein S10 [Cyberlindnera jadinii NRRL Y-1542]ODV74814.1 ribosomal protein S10 [Cyberlindnera jadinii NRRL Y-1542]CEP21517.1 unnamed protein product [Cyberlindnera jadinii]
MLRSSITRSARCFATSRPSLRGAVKTVENLAVKDTTTVPYEPKVLSREEVLDTTKTPFPINVELNYHAPLRHEVRYGDKVAEIQFRAYDFENLEFLADFAQRAAYYLDIPVSGVIPLPTRRERWTVIRAPFVHAKSKENFLRLTHKRVLKAYDATPEVIDLWISYIAKHSNAGVGIKVQTFQRESVELVQELDKIDLGKIEQFNGSVEGQAAVSKRVQELLNDPVFKRHIPEEKLEAHDAKEQIEEKQK